MLSLRCWNRLRDGVHCVVVIARRSAKQSSGPQAMRRGGSCGDPDYRDPASSRWAEPKFECARESNGGIYRARCVLVL